jgi:hypothetical protein
MFIFYENKEITEIKTRKRAPVLRRIRAAMKISFHA